MKIQIILVLLLFIASCSPVNPTVQPSDFLRGKEGLEFEFVEGRPPTELYAGDAVPVAIRIHNRGATPITYQNPAVISISYDNYYIDFVGVTQGKPDLTYFPGTYGVLYGKSLEFPHGEISQDIALGLLSARKLQGQVQTPETELFVNICYPYNTTFHTIACVNSDFYLSDERQEVCQPQIITDSEGQGGPIAVTKITPRITLVRDFNQEMPIGRDGELIATAVQEVKPLFEIEIQNKNDGIPYALLGRSSASFCELSSVNRRTDINKVEVSATLDATESNPGILDCNQFDPNKNSAVLTLIDGKGTIFCELPNDATIVATYNYFAQLSIYMKYAYAEGKSLDLELVRKTFE